MCRETTSVMPIERTADRLVIEPGIDQQRGAGELDLPTLVVIQTSKKHHKPREDGECELVSPTVTIVPCAMLADECATRISYRPASTFHDPG